MIVDAHAHAFAEVRGHTVRGRVHGAGWGRVTEGDRVVQVMPPAFEGTSFPAEALVANMDWAGVDRAVILQGCFYGEENTYVAAACAAHPDRLCGLSFVDPWEPGARASFDHLAARGIYRGLKLECSVPTGLLGLHPGARLDDASLTWLWDALERRSWSLVLDLGAPGSASYQTDAVREIARAHPGLRIVIAHLGQPGPWVDSDRGKTDLWTRQVSLGNLPNIWFDTASLPVYHAGEGYPWAGAAACIRRALSLIGARRLLWGTDAPGLLAEGTYPQLRRWVETALDGVPAADRAAVMGGNAQEVFGLS